MSDLSPQNSPAARVPGSVDPNAPTNVQTPSPAGHETAAPDTIAPLPGDLPPLPGDFVATLPLPPGSGVVVAPTPVRGYQIVRELGRGGMGVVYLARQVGLNRLVALKMILTGEFAHAEEITRFRHEAEAVAQLKHPNIIQIHDIGEMDGRPYFAMELADGGSLADRLTGSPLPPADAARLLETLARAMHHAHSAGIIHRDLKPANVLLSVTDTPQKPSQESPADASLTAKITDFGLAKRMDSQGRTVSGRVVGTVNYMAPEQAEGRSRDVGPRSDVYGLGAILYECLTGRPPFMADTLVATLEQVRTQEPTPVHLLNPSCPRDLETICLKCLDKDADRRYQTALDLAEDLHAFLDNRPIRARPVSTWERVWRGIQRRRREVILSGCTLLAIALLAGFLINQRVARNHERQQARDSYIQAVEAIRGTRELLTDGNSSPERVERLLRELPHYYQRVQQPVEDIGLLDLAAQECATLGETLWKQGRKYEASDACKVAQRLYGELVERNPTRGSYRDAMAMVRVRQGQLRADARDFDAADAEFRAALDELTRLTQGEGEELDYQRHRAEVYHQLGELYNNRKRRKKAVEFYVQSLQIRERIANARPKNRNFRRDLARSFGYLGDTYLDQGKVEESWDAYEKAEKIRQQLVDEKPTDADARFQLARSHANEGYYWLWLGDVPKSLSGFDKARPIQEKLLVENPGLAEYAGDLGWSLLHLAELTLECEGPTPEARQWLERARKLYSELPASASYSRNLARAHIGLALHHRKADEKATRDSLARAREILTRLNDEDRQRRSEDPDDLYQLAVVEAVEMTLLPSDQVKQRHAQADQAMLYLDLAIRFGYTRVSRLGEKVAGLEPLWKIDRERMEAIVARCRAAARPEPERRAG